MNEIPIATLISSYKEGTLIQGAIRSTINLYGIVIVWDGLHREGEVPGEDSEVTPFLHERGFYLQRGNWSEVGEAGKRTLQFQFAKQHYEKLGINSFWVLILDADEILVWPEYLHDWLNVLQPEYPSENLECIVPLKRTEAEWSKKRGYFVTDIAPSRLFHSSIFERFTVSCLRIQTPDQKEVSLHHYPSKTPPSYGEPHIHHRHYLRRYGRAQVRASQQEERDWIEKQKTLGGFTEITAFTQEGEQIQVEGVE